MDVPIIRAPLKFVHRASLARHRGQGKSCWHGGQLTLNNSQNVAIYGNTIESIGINAICVVNATRQDEPMFPQALANVSVSSNVIKIRGMVTTGMAADTLPLNVIFSGNTYYLDSPAGLYWVYETKMSQQQWQATGQDVTGSFLVW